MIAETIKATHGNEGARRATEVPWGGTQTAVMPDPEVPAKASRRRFTSEYKRRILKEADACTDVGALLRREGLYASNLTTWRKQMNHGVLTALSPKKRGRKESSSNPLQIENEQLRKENNRLELLGVRSIMFIFHHAINRLTIWLTYVKCIPR